MNEIKLTVDFMMSILSRQTYAISVNVTVDWKRIS